jgi:hypothetical protein
MWRIFAGAGAALLVVVAGFFIWTGRAHGDGDSVPEPPARAGTAPLVSGAPARPPSADERTREQRRFGRADRDNDGRVTLEEMTYGRRRAFARLDTDHNGQLSFEESAARLLQRFASADADHDHALNRAEFAATAPAQRRTAAANPRCNCASRGNGEGAAAD